MKLYRAFYYRDGAMRSQTFATWPEDAARYAAMIGATMYAAIRPVLTLNGD